MTSNLSSFFITLVRHGETAANKARVIQGQIEVNLNVVGKKQAELLSNLYKKNNLIFNLIYTSNLSRALDTCKIIVSDYQEKININKLLIERAFGKNEGRPLEEFYDLARKAGYTDNLSKFTPEGAEKLEDVYERVRTFCKTILIKDVKPNFNVLVVAHGAVIREFLRFFKNELKVDFNGLEPFKLTPNSGSNEFRIIFKDNKLIGGECYKLHDVSHLENFDFSQLIDEEEPFDIIKLQKSYNKTIQNFVVIQSNGIKSV